MAWLIEKLFSWISSVGKRVFSFLREKVIAAKIWLKQFFSKLSAYLKEKFRRAKKKVEEELDRLQNILSSLLGLIPGWMNEENLTTTRVRQIWKLMNYFFEGCKSLAADFSRYRDNMVTRESKKNAAMSVPDNQTPLIFAELAKLRDTIKRGIEQIATMSQMSAIIAVLAKMWVAYVPEFKKNETMTRTDPNISLIIDWLASLF